MSGKVVRGDAPLEGAYVRLIGPTGDFVSERRTGADGTFRFHLPPGSWRIRVFAPGSPRMDRELTGEEEEEILLKLGG
ncbi:MAG: DUF1416 domain-containing protein [Actinomycetota bacterium]